MALTVIKPSGIDTSGNYTVNGMNVSANATVANLSVTTSLTLLTNSANLGPVGNVIITGGTNGYVLQTDGAGNLSWVAQSGGGSTSNISNGNSNVNIPSANGNINFSAVGNTVMVITGTGVNVAGTLNTGSGIITGNGNGLSSLVGANVTGQVGNALVSGTVYTNAQPNITSVGNLTGLTVSNATGVVNFTTTANVTLGTVANLHIFGGTSSQYLQTDGAGNLSWSTVASGSTSNISNGNSNVNIPTANGNINLTAVGNTTMVITGTGANISGTANVTGNLIAGNITAGNGAGGSITGGNLVSANYLTGTLTTAAQPNITSVGSLTGLTVSNVTGVVNFTTTANVTLGAVANLHITGGASSQYLQTDGTGNLTWAAISSGSGISNGTSNISIPVTNGNINLTAGGNTSLVVTDLGANIAGTLNTTGNITGGNLLGSHANGNSNVNIPSANGNINLTAVGNTTMVITGTGANINGTANITGNLIGGSDLNVSGNGVFGGNLTVNGTLTYINSTTLSISDPIINLQTGPNGAAPVANTGKDVGTALNYYDTSAKIAWMGWDISNAEISFGSNVSISSEVVTFTELANIRSGNASLGNNVSANFFTGNGSLLTGVTTASISNGNSNVNIPLANGNINFSAEGNANILIVTGTGANITGNLTTTNIITGNGAGGNIINANVISANTFIASSNVTAGNANLGNLVIANFFSGAGNNLSNISAGNVTGQVGNSLISGTVYTNAQPNITSVGSLTGLTVSNASGVVNFTTTSNVTLGAVANLHISGGTNGYVLQTDGAGTLSWVVQSAGSISNISNGNSNVNIPAANGNVNITAVGNTSLVVTGTGANISGTLNVTGNLTAGNLISSGTGGNITNANVISANTFIALTSANFVSASNVDLGAVGNIKITGGTNAYVLSTDGTGNLSWVAQSGGGGGANISNGNSNVNIPTSNGNINFSAIGNANVVVITGTGANIEGTANITGNLSAGNASLGNLVTANFFSGAGNNLSNISASNVTGQVGNSLIAGTVYTNAQPNITSVGSLTGLTVSNATGIVDFTTTANVTLGAVGNLHISGGSANYVLQTDGSGTLSWAAQSGGGGGANISNGNSNVNIPVAGGNINFSATGNANVMTITGTGANISGYANITGNIALSGANVSLGNVSNLHITGGSNTFVLSTDGSGNLSWAAASGTSIGVDNFTGNGVQTAYTLTTTPANANATLVSIAGTFQPRTVYSLTGNVITFSSAPPNTAPIEVTTFTAGSGGGGGGITAQDLLSPFLLMGA